MQIKPPRTPWPAGFPTVVLHAAQSAVLQHERYSAAKAGDARVIQFTTYDADANRILTAPESLGAGHEHADTARSAGGDP